MMKKMGVKAYRFSISWTRILPDGRLSTGLNKEGVDYYNNLINELLLNGITPYVTLFHWDTPEFLEEEYMGFLSEKIIYDFTAYAEVCFREFGDRVKHWITINEPQSYASCGYASGDLAPGRGKNGVGDPGTEPYIVAHNLLLCHAAVVKLYRQRFQKSQGGKIGITLNVMFFEPLNVEKQEDKDSAHRAIDFIFGWFMDPLFNGKYPETMITNVSGGRLPEFTEEQAKLLIGSYDFLGLNYYSSQYATKAEPSQVPSYLTDWMVHQQGEGLNGKLIGPQVYI
jgi:beta-glucosidase/6-phospho-beta-glucosidase/beta-galactosidase